jgi:hypothetical protein
VNIHAALTQAEWLVDEALDAVVASREELLEAGLGAFALGRVTTLLAEVVSDIHHVRRLLPGYKRGARKEVTE